MKSTQVFSLLLILTAYQEVSAQKIQSTPSAKNELLDTEIRFSRLSATHGFKAAYFQFADDSALVFRPHEKNALVWAGEQPDSIMGIRWYPSFIDMSAAGDLGYAVGPFENHYDIKDTSKFITGQFATVWKRQENGTLKFIMDFGSNRLPDDFILVKEPLFQPTAEKASPQKFNKKDRANNVEYFKKAEAGFARMCRSSGDLDAFRLYAGNNIRFIQQRVFYVKDKDATLLVLARQKGIHHWTITKTTAALSGDLVHVSGFHEYIENNTKKNGYFMRIWKRQKNNTWKIVLQVSSLTD